MNVSLSESDVRPIVQAVVAEVLAALPVVGGGQPARLAYSESEAAAILGVNRHVLRDVRLRGEITATRVGGRISYEIDELRRYLAANRQTP